jgi:hypothetical protein
LFNISWVINAICGRRVDCLKQGNEFSTIISLGGTGCTLNAKVATKHSELVSIERVKYNCLDPMLNFLSHQDLFGRIFVKLHHTDKRLGLMSLSSGGRSL